jgi:hypothetical protein
MKPAVLIVAYRRFENLERILRQSIESGCTEFFISVDGPQNNSAELISDQNQLKSTVLRFQSNEGIEINYRFLQENYGCGVSVFSACDWAFSQCESLVIIEDDCIPSPSFFDFAEYSLTALRNNKDCLLFCGTQFVPPEIQKGEITKSRYALTWGWGTTNINWRYIKQFFLNENEKFGILPFNIDFEQIYWHEGSRRAMQGYADVWDTTLLNLMQRKNKYAIMPPIGLVSNIGNDSHAVHTKKSSPWLNRETGEFSAENQINPIFNLMADEWIAKNFFRISPRHLISTRITRIKDFFDSRPKVDFKSNFLKVTS